MDEKWTQNVPIGSRASLYTDETPFFAGAFSAGHGDATRNLLRKKKVTDPSKPGKEDTENEHDSSDSIGGEDSEDTETNDPPTEWLTTVSGTSLPRPKRNTGNFIRPTNSRRSRTSIAHLKIPRYPPRGEYPTIESGADVTIQ